VHRLGAHTFSALIDGMAEHPLCAEPSGV
jgi:hypothetical protein